VPLIFLSDATHLTNFAGDGKAWPVYMTIGNLLAAVRNAPSTQSVLLVALLPVPIKLRDISKARREFQREHNRLVHQYVLRHLLAPLEHAEGGVFTARCADGHTRRCYATVAAWLADYPEHCELQNLRYGSCIWCECPADKMGEYHPPTTATVPVTTACTPSGMLQGTPLPSMRAASTPGKLPSGLWTIASLRICRSPIYCTPCTSAC
jgi:hypothetical protein